MNEYGTLVEFYRQIIEEILLEKTFIAWVVVE